MIADTTTDISAGTAVRAANWSGLLPPSSCWARRFVRFDTGSSSDAVFAIHTVVRANGSGDNPA
jgi:hypothetical protein